MAKISPTVFHIIPLSLILGYIVFRAVLCLCRQTHIRVAGRPSAALTVSCLLIQLRSTIVSCASKL